MELRIAPLGDTALTVRFGDRIDLELNAFVAAAAHVISSAKLPGVSDVVPAYASLSVHYDPIIIEYRDIEGRVRGILAGMVFAAGQNESSRLHRIPVRYDGEDLAFVAEQTGMTVDEIVSIHSAREYRALVIGFVPGFAYLGPLDERLVVPRRDSPRKRVPAGSVAIAEAQTGVYPSATPGGWHLIGHTQVTMFDAARAHPSLLAVGDRVQFEPLS